MGAGQSYLGGAGQLTNPERTWTVSISAAALRQLAKIERQARVRIQAAIDDLARNPRPRGCEKLAGSAVPLWRIRIGNYRVIYIAGTKELVVSVIQVGHRREIYRDL